MSSVCKGKVCMVLEGIYLWKRKGSEKIDNSKMEEIFLENVNNRKGKEGVGLYKPMG